MIRRTIGFLSILFLVSMGSQAYATHIQYVSLADVSGVEIGQGDIFEWTFDLVNDDMYLWDIDTPTTTFGPTPDVSTADSIGSYDPLSDLHYVTLRINPNNVWSDPSSTYISLTVNGITFTDWSNPIRLYDWGVPGDDISDPYGIADNDYKITVILTGLTTLEDKSPISITNVNLEGCFDTATPVPEPATMLLLGLGLTGMVGLKRKSKMS